MNHENDLNITNEELPGIIEEQYNNIIEIDNQIKRAEELCFQAQEKVNSLSTKKIKTNEVINNTQEAVKYLSEAQVSLAESQKMLFLNQQKMVEGMKYLLMLGSSSIAMNKTVIEQLEAKLKHASFEKLSLNSRNELLGVIRLLKEQENTLITTQRINTQLNETRKKVIEHEQEINVIHQLDQQQNIKDEEHDILLEESAENDLEHDKLIKRLYLLSILGLSIAVIALIIGIINLVL